VAEWLKHNLIARRRASKRAATVKVQEYRGANRKDFGRPGVGTCPVCGHHGCFGRSGRDASRWYCFSGGHAEVLGVDGRPVGRKGKKGYTGDVLDLDAFAARKTRPQLLRPTHSFRRVTSVAASRPQQPEWSAADLEEVFQERLAVRIVDGCLPEPIARVLARADVQALARCAPDGPEKNAAPTDRNPSPRGVCLHLPNKLECTQ